MTRQDLNAKINLKFADGIGLHLKTHREIEFDILDYIDEQIIQNSGNGITGIISTTKANLDTLITDKLLKPGFLYAISGAAVAAQIDGILFIRALSINTLSGEGVGLFFNPDHHNNGDYGSNLTGSRGKWGIVSNNQLNDGDVVIYNNQHWPVINAGALNTSSPPNNQTAFGPALNPANPGTGYIKEVDLIGYDYNHDWITYRKDVRNNIVAISQTWRNNYYEGSYSSFPWGNNDNYDNSVVNAFIDAANQISTFHGIRIHNTSYEGSYARFPITNHTVVDGTVSLALGYASAAHNDETLAHTAASTAHGTITKAGLKTYKYKNILQDDSDTDLYYVFLEWFHKRSFIANHNETVRFVEELDGDPRSMLNVDGRITFIAIIDPEEYFPDQYNSDWYTYDYTDYLGFNAPDSGDEARDNPKLVRLSIRTNGFDPRNLGEHKFIILHGQENTNAFTKGVNTIAGGFASSAEGEQTLAAGDWSNASGVRSIAAGLVSRASGVKTLAAGKASNASGDGSKALGDYSNASGKGTEAYGPSSTAIGQDTIAEGAASFAYGNGTEAEGNNSVAGGHDTLAKGENSRAEGYETETRGDQAVATGEKTKAFGHNSLAEGFETAAIGRNSHAQNKRTLAYGENCTAIGEETKAGMQYYQIDEFVDNGDGTVQILLRDYHTPSVLIRNDTYVYLIDRDYQSVQDLNDLYRQTQDLISTSMLWLINDHFIDEYRVSINITSPYNYLSDYNANPEFWKGRWLLLFNVSKNNASASGEFTYASGANSTSRGYGTIANGDESTAEGTLTRASGVSSHSEGFNTEALAEASHAGGIGAVAKHKGEMARSSGYFNKPGDAQTMQLDIMYAGMFDGTEAELTIGGISPGSLGSRIKLDSREVYTINIILSAISSNGHIASLNSTWVVSTSVVMASLGEGKYHNFPNAFSLTLNIIGPNADELQFLIHNASEGAYGPYNTKMHATIIISKVKR